MIVEVAYATPEKQVIKKLEVDNECTVGAAILQSGVLAEFPEIDLTSAKLGVFSERASVDDALRPNDRVEIYRPLTIDPKQARLLRAKKTASVRNSTD